MSDLYSQTFTHPISNDPSHLYGDSDIGIRIAQAVISRPYTPDRSAHRPGSFSNPPPLSNNPECGSLVNFGPDTCPHANQGIANRTVRNNFMARPAPILSPENEGTHAVSSVYLRSAPKIHARPAKNRKADMRGQSTPFGGKLYNESPFRPASPFRSAKYTSSNATETYGNSNIISPRQTVYHGRQSLFLEMETLVLGRTTSNRTLLTDVQTLPSLKNGKISTKDLCDQLDVIIYKFKLYVFQDLTPTQMKPMITGPLRQYLSACHDVFLAKLPKKYQFNLNRRTNSTLSIPFYSAVCEFINPPKPYDYSSLNFIVGVKMRKPNEEFRSYADRFTKFFRKSFPSPDTPGYSTWFIRAFLYGHTAHFKSHYNLALEEGSLTRHRNLYPEKFLEWFWTRIEIIAGQYRFQ